MAQGLIPSAADPAYVPTTSRRRAANPAVPPPDVYIPPILPIDTPHPGVTLRTAAGYQRHDVVIPSPQGKVPLVYGRQQLAGQILYFFSTNNYVAGTFNAGTDFWYVLGLARGEANQLLGLYRDGSGPFAMNTTSYNIWWYAGTQTQTVDSHLAAVDASWNEALPGISYAIVQLIDIQHNWPQLPNWIFDGEWRKVLDPETGVTAYRVGSVVPGENTILQHYDYARDPEGKALPVSRINTASIITAKNIAYEALGSGTRYRSHVIIDGGDSEDWVKTFMILCDGWWHYTANQWYIGIDRPGTAIAAYDDSHFALDPEPRGDRANPDDRINEVVIEYTDTTNKWAVVPIKLFTDAVKYGREPRRSATYRLPWLHDLPIVKTKLVYLLNKYQYDAKLHLQHLASTSDRQVGDIITQSVAARGIAAQLWRLGSRQRNENGTFDDVLVEYNAAMYADTLGSAPSMIASTTPDVQSAPPEVQAFSAATITEELYQPQSGVFATRARITWTMPAYPWLEAVELYFSIAGGEYRYYSAYTGGAASPMVAVFDGIMELGPYSFKLVVRNQFGSRSTGVIAAKTFVGKTTVPADVPYMLASPLGPRVVVSWPQTSDLDLVEFEVRRGTTTSTFASATRVYRGNQREIPDEPPVGVWRYFVQAVDAAGHYSTTAAFADVRVFFNGPGGTAASNFDWQTNPALYGAGNRFGDAIVTGGDLQTVINGVSVRSQITVMLSRLFGPGDADAEITANGYTSIGQWETALDAPRRGGAGIWAPLALTNGSASGVAIADQEFGGDGGGYRNARFKWFTNATASRLGVDSGIVVAKSSVVVSVYTAPWSSSLASYIMSTPIDFDERGAYMRPGIKLQTNSPYCQEIVQAPLVGFFGFSYQQATVPLGVYDVTTDASGFATVTLTQPMRSGQVPSPSWAILNSLLCIVTVFSISNTSVVLRALTPSGAAAVSGVQLRVVCVDAGGGGTTYSITY
jgi:hypothetical protein